MDPLWLAVVLVAILCAMGVFAWTAVLVPIGIILGIAVVCTLAAGWRRWGDFALSACIMIAAIAVLALSA